MSLLRLRMGSSFFEIYAFVIDLFVILWKAILLHFQALISLVFPPSPSNIHGQVVLITDGGYGLGKELALLFSKNGAKVVVWDADEEASRNTADEVLKHSGVALAYRCDISNSEDVMKTAAQVLADVGPVSILVNNHNNAGILHHRPLIRLNREDIRHTIEVNTLSHFWTIREFLPSMLEAKKGHIVSVSSMAGRTGFANLTAYGASKFAVAGLMASLADEMRLYGHWFIHCTTVYSLFINTNTALKPKVKYPWLSPTVEPDYAAKVIVDGVLRNERQIFVPRCIVHVWRLIGCLPMKIQGPLMDFLGFVFEEQQ